MKNEIPDLVRGHEAWLEPAHLHFHSGGEVEIKVLWGHMMQRDGMGRPENWRAVVIDPAGKTSQVDIGYGEGLYHTLNFTAGPEGLYTVALENKAGVYCVLPDGAWVLGDRGNFPQASGCTKYHQWARVAIPVGHHIHGSLETVVNQGLDLYPGEYREYRPGDNIDLQAYYHGRPLAGAEVKAVYHLFTGVDYPLVGKTGPDGHVSFTFNEKGHWMFIVTYRDESEKLDAKYDATVYTTTFVVPGVK